MKNTASRLQHIDINIEVKGILTVKRTPLLGHRPPYRIQPAYRNQVFAERPEGTSVQAPYNKVGETRSLQGRSSKPAGELPQLSRQRLLNEIRDRGYRGVYSILTTAFGVEAVRAGKCV